PACLMAAATVNTPAIVLSGGPMLNGWWKGERAGSGTVVWKAREELAAGRLSIEEFFEIAAASAPSVGHCNTMGTASPMTALAEEYHRAGGLPAVMHELLKAKRIHGDALTINGKTMGENVRNTKSSDADVIKPYGKPLKKQAGFLVLKGNLFDSAIMKTSVIS